MRVLITGGRGMLASSLKKVFSSYQFISPSRLELDITNSNNVATVFSEFKPNIVIHTAALTNVDYCENNKDEAYRVNVLGTENIAKASSELGAKLVYISSTGIYGDYKDTPYNERDSVKPTTIYHQSKFDGERAAEGLLSDILIIRTGWLFGGEPTHKKNFVCQRINDAKKSKELICDSSQVGNPTYVDELAEQIKKLVELELSGIFNCVGLTPVNRMEYIENIFRIFKVGCHLKEAPSGFFKRDAKVSKNESAVNLKLQNLGIDLMSDLTNALERYKNELL